MVIAFCVPVDGKLQTRTETAYRIQISYINVKRCLRCLTLPEGQEDDGLDDAELEDWLIWAEELLGCVVEQNQAVQRQGHRDVVDDGDVQVATTMSDVKHHILGCCTIAQ